MKFKFSVIISIYNSDLWIYTALDSLINQTIGFEDNIEVILVNDGSTDQSEDICLSFKAKFPRNIRYIKNEKNEGPSVARNLGLKQATGKYVNFLDSDDYFSKDTFKKVFDFFEKNYNKTDIVSIPIFFFGEKEGSHILNFKYNKTQVVNLMENPRFIQLSAASSFFRRDKLYGLEFNSKLFTSEDVVFLNQLLLKNPNLGVLKGVKYYYRKRSSKNSLIDSSSFSKEYFNNRVEHYFNFLVYESLKIFGKVPKFIQYTLMYDLQWIFNIPKVDNILSDGEIKSLHSNLYNLLQYIDDDVIYNQKDINNDLKANILYFKHKNLRSDPLFKESFNKLSKSIINKLKLNTVYIDIYEIKNNNLYILGIVSTFFKECEVYVLVNGKKLKTDPVNFPQRDRYSLNHKYFINQNFEINIPLSKDKTYEIEFLTSLEEFGKLFIDFSRPCNFSKVVGYTKTKDYISKHEDNKIIIKKKNNISWIKEEIKSLYSMVKNHEKGYRTGVPIRIAYMIFYPLLKNKRIWIFMDLPDIADDNGRHLFKYAVNQKDNIKKYFVIERNSFDYNEMNKIGSVLEYKSIKHRFYALFAEKIITSHPDNNIIYPFWGNYPYFAGLLKSSTIFLQHGITKDNVSSWLNKYDKNLDLLVTASKKEYESIFKYPYNYKGNIVKLIGFPRFDNLKNEKNIKQIIIMPSWRRNLKDKPNEFILKSKFFIKFNSLINNERLIKEAKEHGYEIIFKPHPNVYDFIDLFETNDYVKIDYKKIKYQKLFNKGSILITDYSSVAFDFAYLYKPVLYYHYSRDYHFNLNESYFDYETMGFGEVVKNEDDLVDLIIEYLNNDCKLKDKYRNNIINYFIFTDRNNCQRVYDEIKLLPYDGCNPSMYKALKDHEILNEVNTSIDNIIGSVKKEKNNIKEENTLNEENHVKDSLDTIVKDISDIKKDIAEIKIDKEKKNQGKINENSFIKKTKSSEEKT